MYSLILSFQAFFVTGFTFHVVSIFEQAGYVKQEAISIFLPITVVATATSIIGNIISDWIKLKKLLFFMIFGGLLASLGLLFLKLSFGYYAIIIGFGITGGMMAVLTSVVWPRYFGRQHLGAISGKSMSMIVMGSAAGPVLFSLSNTFTDMYGAISFLAILFLIVIAVGSFKADPPIKE